MDQHSNVDGILHALQSIAQNLLTSPIGNGAIKKRQGGDANDYSVFGSTNYDLSTTRLKIQMGTISTSSTTTVITFPEAFAQPPIVVAVPYGQSGVFGSFYINSPTASQFSFVISSTNIKGAIWIAIGQE